MKSPIITTKDGKKTWVPKIGDKYLITGVQYRSNKRFSIQTSTWFHAVGINLWRGSKWLIRDGKRYLIQRVSN